MSTLQSEDRVLQLLRAAADALEAHDHRKGAFGQGLLMSHAPKGDKPWPKPKEIYPWEPRDKVHKLTALSAVGAMCYIAGESPDNEDVQAAIARCNEVLERRGIEWTLETWNDALATTKEEVVALLREA